MAAYFQKITATSPAAPGTVVHGTTFTGLEARDHYKIVATTLGPTGGDLDIYLQGYTGEDWFDVASLPTVGAGDPALSLTGKLYRYSQPPFRFFNWADVGLAATPAIVGGDIDMGDFSDRLRIVFVAGIGTTVGASQMVSIYAAESTHDRLVEDHFVIMGAR